MTGKMQSHPDALPPDYTVVRGCAADFCNSRLQTHDSIPDLSRGARRAGRGGAGRGGERPGGVAFVQLLLPPHQRSRLHLGPGRHPA